MTLVSSWELATLSRRQRASIAPKLIDAFQRLEKGNKQRYFSFFNQATECWILFYFQFGEDRASLTQQLEKLTRLKTIFLIKHKKFKYSVFGYGFRKSFIETGNTFDEACLCIEDAGKYASIDESEYLESRLYFSDGKVERLKEFPE